MASYLLRRILQGAFGVLFIASVVFFASRLTGDTAALLLPESASADDIERLREQLGLNLPLGQQYLIFLRDLVTFQWGDSIATGQPVGEILMRAWPETAKLAIVALIIAALIAIPLGIVSALWKGSVIDIGARTLALLGQSIPQFWLAVLLIYFLGVQLRWLPIIYNGTPAAFVMPALAIACVPVAGMVRLLRSSMLDVTGSEYLTMANAKGIPQRTVVLKHALRNSLIPLITYMGLVLGSLINGSVVVENIFAWPGIGKTMIDAVLDRDFPVVQGAVIFIVTGYVIINILIDLLYVVVDPRLRKKGVSPA